LQNRRSSDAQGRPDSRSFFPRSRWRSGCGACCRSCPNAAARPSTAAICEWNDTFIDRTMPALLCYIDCDGGSVTTWRRIGHDALTARFEPARG